MSTNPTFSIFQDIFGHGPDVPDGWQPLTALPLMILVGVTGVGKSTTIEALNALAPTICVLPNRRELTDALIISHLQQLEGVPVASVKDRATRFAYTRRYRERYPGGMAHALAQLRLAPAAAAQPLLFDGLRGADEVTAAQELLPRATFIVLDAPDAVRIRRLLGRQDTFDQVAGIAPAAGHDFAALGVPEADALLSAAEQEALLALVARGETNGEELAAKLKIVVEERRNYDPAAAIVALRALAPQRTLVIDTTQHTPDEAAALIATRMGPAL